MALAGDWPTIWRCARCGNIVHPADEESPAAWCGRCRAFSMAQADGGRPEVDRVHGPRAAESTEPARPVRAESRSVSPSRRSRWSGRRRP